MDEVNVFITGFCESRSKLHKAFIIITPVCFADDLKSLPVRAGKTFL